MPVDVEIAPESMREIEELRRRHHEAYLRLKSSDRLDPRGRMIVFITSAAGEAWEREAPRLTGTLAFATRERYYEGRGRVFIDPTIVNPLGGRPSIYGPVVHDRYGNAWVQRVFEQDVPKAAIRANAKLYEELDGVYDG